MSGLVAAGLIGIVAGLRTMTAPAAVSWAARLGWVDVSHTPLAFMGFAFTPWVFTMMAMAELMTDLLPTTPSRTVPVQFAARIVTGALSGACLGAARGATIAGVVAGIVGAAIGTLGGHELRRRLAGAFGRDWPAALTEDVIAIVGAYLIVAAVA